MDHLTEGTREYAREEANYRFLLEMFCNGVTSPETLIALAESGQRLGLGKPVPASLREQREHWHTYISRATTERARFVEEYKEDAITYPAVSAGYAQLLALCDLRIEIARAALQKMNTVQ